MKISAQISQMALTQLNEDVLPATNNYKMVKRKRYQAPETVRDMDSTCLASNT